MLHVLRPGTRHPHVELWEEFLRGYDHYMVEVDDLFDQPSVEATKDFQFKHGLKPDGWVGEKTWGKAIELGLDIFTDDSVDKSSRNWPPRPQNLSPIRGTAGRQQVWGAFKYEAAGVKDNPEAIKILDSWENKNIVGVTVPQLAKIPGITYQGRVEGKGHASVQVHRLVSVSFVCLWKAWEDAGLLDRIITWGGLWVPRFVRGSRTSLSNHAFATAFDINAPWNGLRRTPALVGQRGCVRELVELANEYGWWWGGHGWPSDYSKLDGMHFEATEAAISRAA